MHFVKCCCETHAITRQRVLAARGTDPMPGVTSVAAASGRMHLRLPFYRGDEAKLVDPFDEGRRRVGQGQDAAGASQRER